MSHTLSEIVKFTGAKRRSVQLWADAGIVMAVEGTDRAGTGIHRRFEISEVRLIALLVPLAAMGVPIGWLRYFARSFREAFQYDSLKRSRSMNAKERNRIIMARAFERAADGDGHNYLLFTHGKNSLWFDVVTDEESPASVSLPLCFDAPQLAGPSSFVGVLDLNVTLKEL
jgi:hypothetical protein